MRVHSHQSGGTWRISEWGEDHIQWAFAFYLEVVTFHPEDTELGVKGRKVLLPLVSSC